MKKEGKGYTKIQKYAFGYALLFLGVVLSGYVPAFNFNGLLFGLFEIDLLDDALHLFSAAWAFFVAHHSVKQSIIFFKIFGILYTFDGIVGFLVGRGVLDFAIFTKAYLIEGLFNRVAVNLPHLIIGGLAIYLGFKYAKK